MWDKAQDWLVDYIPWKTFEEFHTHLMLRLQPQQGVEDSCKSYKVLKKILKHQAN